MGLGVCLVARLRWWLRTGSVREGRRRGGSSAAQQSTGGTRTPEQIEAGVHGQNNARHLHPGPCKGARSIAALAIVSLVRSVRASERHCKPALQSTCTCVPPGASKRTHPRTAGIWHQRKQPTSQAVEDRGRSAVASESKAGRAARHRCAGRCLLTMGHVTDQPQQLIRTAKRRGFV